MKHDTWFWSNTELYIAIILSFIVGLTIGLIVCSTLTLPQTKLPETYFRG